MVMKYGDMESKSYKEESDGWKYLTIKNFGWVAGTYKIKKLYFIIWIIIQKHY